MEIYVISNLFMEKNQKIKEVNLKLIKKILGKILKYWQKENSKRAERKRK